MSQLSLSRLIKFPSLTSEAALVDFVINISTICGNRFLLQLPNLPLYKVCQRLQEVVPQPEAMKVILNDVRTWKDDSEKARGRYKPCFKRPGGSGKKMSC